MRNDHSPVDEDAENKGSSKGQFQRERGVVEEAEGGQANRGHEQIGQRLDLNLLSLAAFSLQGHHEVGQGGHCLHMLVEDAGEEVAAGDKIVHHEHAHQRVDDRPLAEHVAEEDEQDDEEVDARELVVECVFGVFVERVEDVGGGAEHEREAAYDSPVAVVETPPVKVLADVAAAVVNVDAYDGHGEHRQDVQQSRVVVPDLEVVHHHHAHRLHAAVLGHQPGVGEIDNLEQQGQGVGDGRAEEVGLQDLVEDDEHATREALIEEIEDAGQHVHSLHSVNIKVHRAEVRKVIQIDEGRITRPILIYVKESKYAGVQLKESGVQQSINQSVDQSCKISCKYHVNIMDE